MKRIVFVAGLAFVMLSCAQHDTQSPDTAGTDPQKPNETVTTQPSDSTDLDTSQPTKGGN